MGAMEVDEDDTISKKRKGDSPHERNKKARKFAAKEFRKNLQSDVPGTVVGAVQQFSELMTHNAEHICVLEYLEKGGNCIEILQTLERCPDLSPLLVFDLVHRILLRINMNYPHLTNIGHDTCRYLLNSYVPLLNKMLSLSSSGKERKTALKLLTAIVTFSATLAKDVLLQVNFNPTNIELLTKNTGERDSVRDVFIHFLTAFLIDGHYATLSVLLEKKGLLTSIVGGLKYDVSDTVSIVLTAMRNHILENPSVSKTAKMKVFNTQVVKDIVNLYNWKGPAGIQTDKKKAKIKVVVDEYEKSKVNQAVHQFLLVLCTSHRYGIVFRDHTLGLGKDHQNKLIFTVLDSLERPWEHSYAKELVVKICGACPDLMRTMWKNVKEFLIPRPSTKWLNAVKFAISLVEEMQPMCVDFCIKQLGILQVYQALSHLLLPLPVLKILLVETELSKQPQVVRYNILKLLSAMLTMLKMHIQNYGVWLAPHNADLLQKYFQQYLTKHLPSVNELLENWYVKEESTEAVDSDISCTTLDLLEATFDLIESYRALNPQTSDSFNIGEFDIEEFLTRIANYDGEDGQKYKCIQVKAISNFFSFDPSSFSVNERLFRDSLFILLDYYHETADQNVSEVLHKILKNTAVFEGSEDEIGCWVDGVLHLKQFDSSVSDFLGKIVARANESVKIYSNRLSDLYSGLDYNRDASIIVKETCENNEANSNSFIRHTYLSPLVLALVDHLNETDEDAGKLMKTYIQCVLFSVVHSQTSLDVIYSLLSTCKALSENLINYVKSWIDGVAVSMKNSKCKLTVLQKFSESFLESDVAVFLKDHDVSDYSKMTFDLLKICVFHVSNRLNSGNLSNDHLENFTLFIKFLFDNKLISDKFLEIILSNPVVSRLFSIVHLNKNKTDMKTLATKLIIDLLKKVQDDRVSSAVSAEFYRNKCVAALHSLIKKPQKYSDYNCPSDILEIFHLKPDDCRDILNSVSSSLGKIPDTEIPTVYFNIIVYALEQLAKASEDSQCEQLPNNTVESVMKYVTFLIDNRKVDTSPFSKQLRNYLMKFPKIIAEIPESYVISLMNLEEYIEDNANLLHYIFINRREFIIIIRDNVAMISKKKGLFLCLLSAIVFLNPENEYFEILYEHFEPSIVKALSKPQKAGQHFEKHHKPLGVLLERCMLENTYKNYIDKVQKYETAEPFHAYLLGIIFAKALKNGVTEKQIHNMVLTCIHLNVQAFKRKVKSEDDGSRLNMFGEIFKCFLQNLSANADATDFTSICSNDTFKLFCKFCLKFGISESHIYLEVLKMFLALFKKYLLESDVKLVMEMMVSHSEFLDLVLGEASEKKVSLLHLFLGLCKDWPQFMERSHMPALLSAYNATLEEGDRIILQLLRMYEAADQQTHFYEFKPLLWGRAASNHYSVRQDIQKAILRQPKVADVLEILQENVVTHTIKNHPLGAKLRPQDFTTELVKPSAKETYDLAFLLPLFSELLAQENVVPTYKFSKSGALSLTVIALSKDDPEMRATACHVLHKFYGHVEAKTTGKDLGLWIRFVEVICKGAAAFDDHKLHNFASVYLADTALILTQPNHVMYVPLSHYLSAKADLDFSTIPELYTFLFSSEVNHEHHRRFILEILHDGCRTEKDVTVFMKSMAYKLIMAMFSAGAVCDVESKRLILGALVAVTRHKLGCRILCENHSLLAFLKNSVDLLLTLHEAVNNRKSCKPLAEKFLEIIDNVRTNGMVVNRAAKLHANDISTKLQCIV